jgi:hypothetical protein
MISRTRIFAPVLIAISVALASGCGGAGESAGGGAGVVPLDAVVYASIDADKGSAQWDSALAVLDRLPGAREAADQALVSALADENLDFGDDVDPALGPEVVAVLLPGGHAVGLTQPDDADKLLALLEKTAPGSVTAEIEGWTAVAAKQADLDAYQQQLARGRLEDDERFTDVASGLPTDALAHVYLRGSGLASLASGLAGGAMLPGLGTGIPSTAALGEIGLALSAEDDGLKLSGVTRSSGEIGSSYTPTLLSRVPADARIVLSFSGSDALLDNVRGAAGGAGAAKQFEDLVGVPLDRLVQLFAGEGVVYLRNGGGTIPEATVVLQPADPAAALQTLKQIADAVAKRTDATVETATVAGQEITRLHLGDLTVELGRVDDVIVATNAAGGIASFAAVSSSLADDSHFKAAGERAGFDATTSGLLYVDVDGLVPLVTNLAGDLPAGAPDALAAIDDVFVQTSADGSKLRFTGFVRVP